jgi:RNA polymerase-interacting CarD/CdnL/TRCF family regulator
MESGKEGQYNTGDYARAAAVAAHLAKTGYDLSESERTTLRAAARVLQSWAQSLPRK